ncbi:hypothetical protein VNO77_20229 [Canavalia gladiata]|uniref:Uncharacterized protein n=1 Tax=Canavalia gladiata TaxID=3824 RepID=A0AAN9LNW5_CANGL
MNAWNTITFSLSKLILFNLIRLKVIGLPPLRIVVCFVVVALLMEVIAVVVDLIVGLGMVLPPCTLGVNSVVAFAVMTQSQNRYALVLMFRKILTYAFGRRGGNCMHRPHENEWWLETTLTNVLCATTANISSKK